MTRKQNTEEGEENKDEEENQNFFHKMMPIPNEKDFNSNHQFLGNKKKKSPSPKKDSLNTRKQGNTAAFFQKKPCQYYMNGFCTKGKYCKFSHDMNINTNSHSNSNGAYIKQNNPNATSYSQLKNLKRDLCKYYVNGKCLKGDNCTFSHTLNDFPCKTFQLTGYCEEEENCK